jgi:iron(III) transport system ATP-binding protein
MNETASTTHAPALVATGLRRRLGDRNVLDGIDLSVSAGELVTLVGPSGCGKSTFLRALAGLEPLDAGTVVLDGKDVTNMPAEKRRVGLVFQNNALFGHMRVERNVAFGLKDLPRQERATRVKEMLSLVKLEHLARRYPHQLSGGEQQRVAVARALAPRPAVVLLDEPFGALDEILREDIGLEVKEILAAQRTAAILVTHDRSEAMQLGDRVAIMNEGKILQCDTPHNVVDHPASEFVSRFLAPRRQHDY